MGVTRQVDATRTSGKQSHLQDFEIRYGAAEFANEFGETALAAVWSNEPQVPGRFMGPADCGGRGRWLSSFLGPFRDSSSLCRPFSPRQRSSSNPNYPVPRAFLSSRPSTSPARALK